MKTSLLSASALVLAVLGAGCLSASSLEGQTSTAGSSEGPGDAACRPVAPQNDNSGLDLSGTASVSNQPRAFSYSREGLVTAALQGYVWENPVGVAAFSGSLQGAGRVAVTVYDACGAPVLGRTLDSGVSGGSETDVQGAPGAWTVQLEFAAFAGIVSFSLAG